MYIRKMCVFKVEGNLWANLLRAQSSRQSGLAWYACECSEQLNFTFSPSSYPGRSCKERADAASQMIRILESALSAIGYFHNLNSIARNWKIGNVEWTSRLSSALLLSISDSLSPRIGSIMAWSCFGVGNRYSIPLWFVSRIFRLLPQRARRRVSRFLRLFARRRRRSYFILLSGSFA